MTTRLQKLFDWFVRDVEGKVVIGQAPNLPIFGWLACTILAKLSNHGSAHNGLHLLAQAFLFTWAYGEIRYGSSRFRRVLGVIVGVFLLRSFFHLQ